MHRAGQPSCRFESDNLDILHCALFVRDAAALPVRGSADVPPALIGEIPVRHLTWPELDRAIAGEQWLIWWRQMLNQAVREAQIRRAEDPAQDMRTRMLARVEGRHEVFDPPEFDGLSPMAELRSAVVALLPEYRAWSAGTSRNSAPGQDRFSWQLVRDAAHLVAAQLGVSVDEMDAVAHVLDVQGCWSYVVGAGCGVCSVGAAVGHDTASALLRELFMSGSTAGV